MSHALHSTLDKDFSTSSSDEPVQDSDHHNEQQNYNPLQRTPNQFQENAEFDFTNNTSAPAPTISSSTTASDVAPVTSPATAVAAVATQPQQEQPQPQKVINSPPSYSEVSLDSPSLKITLLCMNSTRITLEFDQKFIASHGLAVKTPDSITIGQFKQLIYNEWMSSQKQAEGEDTDDHQGILGANEIDTNKKNNWGRILAENVTPVPVSPLHVRIIYLGKVLVDEYTFEDYSISSSNANNVLHISIKPDIAGSKDKSSGGKQNKSRRRSTTATHASGGNTTQGAAVSNEGHENDHSSSRSGCCVIC